jgi:threonine aldolase
MYFASDNSAPAHPKIMESLQRVNDGYTSGYGGDGGTTHVRDMIREVFEAPDAAVYLVTTGTAANALVLATLVEPWQTVFCHPTSHIEEDECGAPEFFTNGAKLTLIEGADGKIDADAFRSHAKITGQLGVHNIQRGALSLTNVTEVGTIYTLSEIRTLTSIAKDLGIATHLDGARFANAMVALDCTPAEMTWKSGIDAVSFGGTKNGCMGVEAVVLFDPDKAWEFELRRKRGGHLMSKYRYLSAQMEAYLTDDLWIKLAKHANAMGDLLAAGIKDVKGAKFHHPQQANMLFCGWPRSGHTLAQAAGSMYYAWPEAEHPEKGPSDEQLSARLVTSWSTTPQDVERFLDLIAG